MTDLKLIALDAEDLGVFSAHLQDAVLKVGDMAFLKKERRFAAIVNRFDHVSPEAQSKKRQQGIRRRAALRLERVNRAQLQNIDIKHKDRVLVLLALHYEAGPKVPSGDVTLLFAGGAAIKLEVECIEAELRDLGAAWKTKSLPNHDD